MVIGDEKQKKDKEVITVMVSLYCKKNHGTDVLCDDCEDLLRYCYGRIGNCKFIGTKTFCSKCKSKCYSPKYKAKIREIMKFSGPRIIFYHPIFALKHFISNFK